jgi:hypothetical protein
MEKAKLVRFIAVSFIILSLVWASPAAFAHLGTLINSGWAAVPPVINGNLAAGEWSTATVRDFTLEMRSRSTGALNRTLDGRLYVMNNRTSLFIAIQIFKDDYEAQDFSNRYDGIAVLFDDNHDGILSVGDNGEGFTAWKGSLFYLQNDLYYAGGGFWDSDVDGGKTNDGALGWSHTNPIQGAIGNWTFEMMIPLVGSDGPNYDFSITTLPKTVGFKIWFQEPGKGLDGVYPDDPAITKNIEEISNAATFGDLTIHPLYTLTITATAGGTTNPAPGQYQYPYRTNVSVQAIPNMMHEFDHWELDSVNVGATNPYIVTMDMNHTLKAVFHSLYALTIQTTTGGTTNPVPGTYIYPNGTLVSVTAIKDSGYEFDHWELDSVDVGTNNPYQVLMNQNHTLKALFVKALSVSITPTDVTITLGDSVTFNSAVTGGTLPYSYQWYRDGNKVLGATSASWTFTPPAIGTYYVYLNVTDYRGRVAISNSARVIVKPPPSPVGGYSVSLEKTISPLPLAFYIGLLLGFSIMISKIKRKKE